MPLPALPAAPSGRLLAVAAVLTATLLLYFWPLVDGQVPPGLRTADGVLQLLAATAAAGACARVAAGVAGRARAAWSLLALGATALACARALAVGTGTLLGAPSSPALVALAAAGTAALLLLGVDQSRPRPALLSVDVALAGVLAALLAWACGPALADGPVDVGEVVRLAGGSVLLGVCVLELTGVSRQRHRPVGLPPELPAGLGLLALSLSLGVVARSADQPALARPAAAAGFAGLALLVLAAVRALRPGPVSAATGAVEAAPDASRAGATLALSVPPVLGVGVLAGAALSGTAVDPLGAALVTSVVLLSWLRLLFVVVEGRARLLRLAEDERQMRHQAFHDQLTGLANRQLFHDRLEHALAVHRRARRPLALLFGDLDGFKAVNDRYGHDAGDLVLRSVADRLAACLRPTDTLARLGGDEFAVLLEDGDQPDVVVQRLLAALQDSAGLPPGAAAVRMSLGVAVVGAQDPTPGVEELLGRADAAMYSAKHAARQAALPAGPGCRAPAPAPRAPVGTEAASPPDEARDLLRTALARDLAEGRLDVVYQPLVDPATGTVAGLEALARWRFAGVEVPPQDFLELAEQAGLRRTLTDHVLACAAGQLRTWSDALGHERLSVAVNLSPGELDDDTLPARVLDVVTRHRLQPGQLVLETTASALGDGRTARRLRDAGALLSLVSTSDAPLALASLHDLPLGSMKIAGAPAGGADTSAEARVRVLRAVGRELDLRVVVERVESGEQLAAVRRLGGLLAQGFLLARPAPAAELDLVVLHGCPVPA